MSETKAHEPLFPLPDDPPEDNLPEPIPLTPEQLAVQAEADERDRQRQLEWAMVVQALNDNSLAVFRAMRRFRNEAEQEQVERVLTSYEAGSFLIDRLGAGLVVDQDLAVVLLNLRRRLIDEYGTGPAAMMLIDRAVSAYRDFIRISGWTGNTALMVEAEFFGRKKPSAEFQDRHGRGAHQPAGSESDPARRALRPCDARGPGGSGSDPWRTEPGGRTIEAGQDL